MTPRYVFLLALLSVLPSLPAAPVVERLIPEAGITVRQLTRIEVLFSEGVSGVDAVDLLINSSPATNLVILGPDQYAFDFAQPATGAVQVAWAPAHDIRDLSSSSNLFAGGTYAYTLDPQAGGLDVRLNEIMAENDRGIRDEDGDNSDWIELYNAGGTPIDLGGWYLTDDPLNLRKWQFPTGVTNLPNGFLLVWASGKDRTNNAARLHTNFRLENSGEYLALVSPNGASVISAFSPNYPPQNGDISYGRDAADPGLLGYFTNATPRAVNGIVGVGLGPVVQFSRGSGTHLSPFSLTLSVPLSNYIIRYHLVTNSASVGQTNVPSTNSPIYSTPLLISNSVQVRARAYPTQPNFFPGTPRTETFLRIDAGATAFSSDLPVIIFHNFGGGIPPSSFGPNSSVGVFMVFDTNNPSGRTSLTNPPVLATRAGAHVRGSSTEGYDKRNLAIETWTEVNRQDRDVEVLGMPAESDWILYAPNQFDRNYLHNPLAMAMGRQIGHYASRTRFAEFFFNTAGGTVTYPTPSGGNYNGVYVVMEKIKVSNARLDIARLDPEDTNAVTITGGYIMKIDRNNDPDDTVTFTPPNWPPLPRFTVNSWNTQPIIFHDPDGLVISQRPLQRQWFINFITNVLDPSLYRTNWTNPVTGYAANLDANQWIENHMLNIFPFNVDGYRLSGYFYKDRGGKLMQGPLWDFDRSQGTGNVDARPFNPRQWRRPIGGDQGTDLFGNNAQDHLGVRWFWRLFNDIDFWQRWVDRWQDLRENIYSTSNVVALIDILANQVREAQPRNAARWRGGNSDGTPNTGTHSADGYSFTFDGSYWGPNGEINFFKKWWTDRLHFAETNFLSRPVLSSRGGPATVGQTVSVTPGAKPGTTTYYTLDGTDPRLPGGEISPSAQTATEPFTITINQNTRLFARNRNPDHFNPTNRTAITGNPPLSTPWSGAAVATFVVTTPPLIISEIMYHPQDPPAGNTNDADNFEYIELKNNGSVALSLIGFRVTNGVNFTFSATNPVTILAPGQRVLIVKNRAAFTSRYGAGVTNIAGEYEGNLDNAGEVLQLEGPLREPILDFAYSDNWYPPTDGLGFSLVLADENAPLNSYSNRLVWRASTSVKGSPGTAEGVPPIFQRVVINEALTQTDPPAVDEIELQNLGLAPADIGGWFLSDDFNDPKKFRIPAGTTLPAGGFRVFRESDFNVGSNAFGLSATGDELFLFSADANTNLTGYFHGFDFGPAANGVSFGRHVISTGADHFVAQATNTLGASNAGPRIGPIVITEIMYHPPQAPNQEDDSRDEYIELYNITDSPVSLFDTNFPGNTWRLTEAVDFAFPANTIVAARGYVLVVGFDPSTNAATLAAFRSKYGVPGAVPVFGPYSGGLNNGEDRVELRRPDAPVPPSGFVPLILVERVHYSDLPPWPVAADGIGPSLQRLVPPQYGNDPVNWLGALPTPGGPAIGGVAPTVNAQPATQTIIEGNSVTFTSTVSGAEPIRYQWRLDGRNVNGATNGVLQILRVLPADAGQYMLVAYNVAGSAVSSNLTLNVLPLPVISGQPVNQVRGVGTNATLSVEARGTGPLRYQWQFNGTNIAGATNATLLLRTRLTDEGVYQVLITDDIGTVTSAPATITVYDPPVIVRQPLPQTVVQGSTVIFSVGVSGREPLRYQWQRNSVALPNETNATLVLTNVQTNQTATSYRVLVSNIFFTNRLSGTALLTVLPDTDGDGMPDVYETAAGLDPNNPADGGADPDGDGMINLEEYRNGTDRMVFEIYLKAVEPEDGGVLEFHIGPDRGYTVQYKDGLGNQPWQRLMDLPAAAASRLIRITNSVSPPTGRFYRAVTPIQP